MKTLAPDQLPMFRGAELRAVVPIRLFGDLALGVRFRDPLEPDEANPHLDELTLTWAIWRDGHLGESLVTDGGAQTNIDVVGGPLETLPVQRVRATGFDGAYGVRLPVEGRDGRGRWIVWQGADAALYYGDQVEVLDA